MSERAEVAEFELGVVLDQKAQVSETQDGDLLVEGYAADFGVDRQDEIFEPGAFNEGLKAYLDSNPVLLYHHKRGLALGQVTRARIDQKGLWIQARIDAPEPGTFAADVYRKIKKGTLRGFSVGGKFYRRFANGLVRIFKADIHEISVTPQPVNPRTLFAVGQKAFADEAPTRADALAIRRACRLAREVEELAAPTRLRQRLEAEAILSHYI
jgi:HK97 family phage prohead protease